MINNIVKLTLWNIVTFFFNCFVFEYVLSVIYSCDWQTEFSAAITSVFSVT